MAKKTKINQMEGNSNFSYNWSRDDGKAIKPSHVEALEESAMDRITEMIKEGYSSGELHDNIRMDDSDGEDGIAYSGWWDVKSTTSFS